MQPDSIPETVNFFVETQLRPASFYMPYEHTHSVLEYYFLRRGKCVYMINDSFLHLEAGNILLITLGTKHNTSYTGKECSERVTVYIRRDALPSFLFEKAPELSAMLEHTAKLIPDASGRIQIDALLRRMSALQHTEQKNAGLLMSLYVSELLTITLSHSITAQDIFIPTSALEPDIERALHLIDTGFDQPLSLAQLSGVLKLNPSYFSHKFCQLTGHSFKKYLNNVRLRHAMHRLIVSDDTITKIAADCGFSSSNYFKDLFRSHMGCSPREYRKKHTVSAKTGL